MLEFLRNTIYGNWGNEFFILFQKPFVPPATKVCTICKICGKEPYIVERIVAEKAWWCKNCFRCSVCNKLLR
jgi:hypothetical protein